MVILKALKERKLRLLATKCKKLGKPDFGLAYKGKAYTRERRDLNTKINTIRRLIERLEDE